MPRTFSAAARPGRLDRMLTLQVAALVVLVTAALAAVPADKLQSQFGLRWADALASGNVFNATAGCKHLGTDAEALDKAWAKAKSD